MSFASVQLFGAQSVVSTAASSGVGTVGGSSTNMQAGTECSSSPTFIREGDVSDGGGGGGGGGDGGGDAAEQPSSQYAPSSSAATDDELDEFSSQQVFIEKC